MTEEDGRMYDIIMIIDGPGQGSAGNDRWLPSQCGRETAIRCVNKV